MIKISPSVVIKLLGSIQGLMEAALVIPLPEKISRNLSKPKENETEYFIVSLKAAFKTEKDAQNFLEFDKKLDSAFV